MTTKCDRCSKPIPIGAKICFECFCELAEEESMLLRLAKYYPEYVQRQGLKFWSTCDRCWPMDCGCRV